MMATSSTVGERRSRRGLLLIAAAMATVLIGGSTFAVWSANTLFTGGTITAGNLDITKATDTTFWDVSLDRTDQPTKLPGTDGATPVLGHAIDLSTWLMVPGDKVAANLESTVTLVGDNLVAKLSVAGFSKITNGITSMTWSYAVYKGDELLVAETTVPSDGSLLYLSAPESGQAAGLDDANAAVYSMTDSPESLTIILYGTFTGTAGDAGQATVDSNGVYTDQGTSGTGTRTDAGKASVLGDMLLQLDQVRDTGANFPPPTGP